MNLIIPKVSSPLTGESKVLQSISFGEKNTFDDWKLIAVTRPIFNPPTQKTVYVDVPGGNGALDLSEALSGYPVYNNRTGSFEFVVLNEHGGAAVDYGRWAHRYSEIANYLNGSVRIAILADDPAWGYEGRFEIGDWKATHTWSAIEVKYHVKPYKQSVFWTTDPWLWDPFNFENGIIYQDIFTDIVIDSPSSWISKKFPGVLFGHAPVTPTFIVRDSNMLDMRIAIPRMGIDKTVRLNDGDNLIHDFVFFGQDEYVIHFRGEGIVSIKFRLGRL